MQIPIIFKLFFSRNMHSIRHVSKILLSIAILACLPLTGCEKAPLIRAVHPALTRVESTVSNVNAGTVKPEQAADLAFGGVGRVERLNVMLGSVVKKDEVLAEIENSDIASMLNLAASETKRLSSLLQSGGSAKTQIDKAQSLQEKMRGMYEKTFIRAPFDGLIVELNLEVGQLSQITTINPKPLMAIVDLKPRYVRAEIDEVDLSRVRLGQNARVKILAVRRESFQAKVRKIIPYVSTIREQDRTAQLELTVDSEGILLPAGASADVEIIVAERENVLSLPARTVMGRGTERFVYCFISGKARKTPVVPGLSNYDRAEILSGLSAADLVLLPSSDGIELSDGLEVKTEVQPWP